MEKRSPSPWEPTPPVMYMRLRVTFSHRVCRVFSSAWLPVSRATSAMPVYRYMARTAWPSAVVCSSTGRCTW